MKISLIVAAAKNGVIGRDNELIWHLPDDLKQFKRLTTGHPIVMGRRTYESIGRPLPGRTSIVISRNQNFAPEGVIVVDSLEKALDVAKNTGTDEVFVIGGAAIYKLALPKTDKIYLTQLHEDFDGDAFFDITDPENWQETSRYPHPTDEKHAVAFDFIELIRK